MSAVPLIGIGIFTVAAILTWWWTGIARNWLVARQQLDIPNERSLHASPIPRGGGIALVLVVLGIDSFATGLVHTSMPVAMIVLLATASYALLGALDDRYSLKVRLRCQLQVAIALGAVAAMFWLTAVPWNLLTLIVGAVLVLVLVWMVNLYNFMDGSDGLAAIQAIGAGLFGAYLSAHQGFESVAFAAATIAGASAGFLLWNWHPARIFMGDAGSYFLGAQFGLLGLATALYGTIPWYWGILLAPFVTDASLTLCRRILRGDKWFAAHRTHAYQLLIQLGWTHTQVALALMALMALMVWPCAWVSVFYPQYGPGVAVFTYAMIATLWMIVVKRSSLRLQNGAQHG
jgi:Fuc2NAc and GlcNAc transferase